MKNVSHADPVLFVQRILRDPGAFVTANDIKSLTGFDSTRLLPVLVRCGCCRFTAPVQDVQHILDALEGAGDHVRDACVPIGGRNKWVEVANGTV